MTHEDLRKAIEADPERAVLLSPDAIRCLLDEYREHSGPMRVKRMVTEFWGEDAALVESNRRMR